MSQLSRDAVIAGAGCPRCRVERGEPCRGRRGPREALHRERWQRADAVRCKPTQRQRSYLRALYAAARESFTEPASRAEATDEITRLLALMRNRPV